MLLLSIISIISGCIFTSLLSIYSMILITTYDITLYNISTQIYYYTIINGILYSIISFNNIKNSVKVFILKHKSTPTNTYNDMMTIISSTNAIWTCIILFGQIGITNSLDNPYYTYVLSSFLSQALISVMATITIFYIASCIKLNNLTY
jgi:hypothetical protein